MVETTTTKAMVLLLFSLVLLSFFSPAMPDLDSDKAALLALRRALGGSELDWNASSSPCSWTGVACDGGGRVSILRLPGAGLLGRIPDGALGNLTRLRTLSLRYNRISGSLPRDLASLVELRNLYLQNNRFSGPIPSSTSSLRNLVRLNLAWNSFSGGIPLGIGSLNRLRTLSLEENQLTGQIPEFNLTFDQFNVSYNELNGSIPRSLRAMPPSSFLGLDVCGLPSKPCPGDEFAPAPPPTPSVDSPDGGKKRKKKLSGGAIAGIVVGSVVGGLLIIFLLLFLRRRGKRGSRTSSVEVVTAAPAADVSSRNKAVAPEGDAAASAVAAQRGETSTTSKKLVFFREETRTFDLSDLLKASAEMLGKGTFGTTYKAMVEGGRTTAVKRLRDVELPEVEFKEKIEVVGAMAHPNLVPLLAYYFSKDEKLFVYDFLPGGSLFALLHGKKEAESSPLQWRTRVEMALSAARGVEYIHSQGPTISHGNIRSSNVLFSYERSPAMVSDQGLAQLASPSSSPRRLTGYQAPELTDRRHVPQAADVYSFGVVLLELLTGKAPAQALVNEGAVDLPRWVLSVGKEDWASKVFDPELLQYEESKEDMNLLLQLAIDCTALIPDARPTMPQVVARIEQIHHPSARSSPQI